LSIVPALLIYLPAGVPGDRRSRKTIMVLTDLLSGGIILFLALLPLLFYTRLAYTDT